MISSICSNSTQIVTNNKNKKSSDGQIKMLQQQKTMVEKQIDNIKGNSNMDMETKQELIKPLEAQIQSIESQIQQIQVNEIDEKNDIPVSNSREQMLCDTSSEGLENKVEVSKDMIFLNMSNTYKQTKSLNSIGRRMNDQANVLNSEAEFDEMTGNYNGAKKKRAEAASNRGKANAIQTKIGRMYDNMDEAVKNTDDLNEKLKYISEDKKNMDYESDGEKVSSHGLKEALTENKTKTIDEFA